MIRSCRPAPPLQHLIRYYYQMEGHLAGAVMVQPVPARSPPIIEMLFGERYRVHRLTRGVVEKAAVIALVGPKTHRVVDLHLQGRVDAFTIAFQPGGLSALFGIPLQVLTNQDFEAGDVIGPCMTELYCRLGEVSGMKDRARIADEYLMRCLSRIHAPSPMAGLAGLIRRQNGCLRISELERLSGIGARQLERRFLREIGIAPKLYSRIVRFEAALRVKSADGAQQWVDIAHALGYHDQMHMVHDFRHLSGASPSAISPQLDMFVRPEVVSGSERGLHNA